MLIIDFEGREAKGLSKGRYDETFAGEDAKPPEQSDTKIDSSPLVSTSLFRSG